MKKNEILKKIADINETLFLIDMVDHWQDNESKTWDELMEQKIELEKELEKIENETGNN